jgi:formylglycine-generating enzyme required for sulfatase activity
MLARAAPATPAATRALSFVGKISRAGKPVAEAVNVAFRFKKAGVTVCSPPPLSSTPDASGNFQIAIPLATCPESLFDGSNVVYDVLVGDEVAIADQAVGFVPQARYADQVGFPECPLSYERDSTASSIVLCKKGPDAMVRVGTGATAFWIDRYEASVREHPDGSGAKYGEGTADYLIPKNGQLDSEDKGYAISESGGIPSTMITWFQADAACRASGKRLATGAEWGFAAMGTPDPGGGNGDGGKCRTLGSLRVTGQGNGCASRWGAEDMIGNAAEWISEWFPSTYSSVTAVGTTAAVSPWGPGYAEDDTTNIASVAVTENWTQGVPAGVLRGGGVWEGTGAGVFSLNLTMAPNHAFWGAGFRCVMPR